MLEWYACIVNVQANDTEGIIKWRNIKQIVQFSRDFKRNLNDAVIPYTCNIIQFLITKSTLNMRWFIWIIWKLYRSSKQTENFERIDKSNNGFLSFMTCRTGGECNHCNYVFWGKMLSATHLDYWISFKYIPIWVKVTFTHCSVT